MWPLQDVPPQVQASGQDEGPRMQAVHKVEGEV